MIRCFNDMKSNFYPIYCRFCGKKLDHIEVYDSKEYCPYCINMIRNYDDEK